MVILSLPNITGRSMTNQGYGKWCSLKKKYQELSFVAPLLLLVTAFLGLIYRPFVHLMRLGHVKKLKWLESPTFCE